MILALMALVFQPAIAGAVACPGEEPASHNAGLSTGMSVDEAAGCHDAAPAAAGFEPADTGNSDCCDGATGCQMAHCLTATVLLADASRWSPYAAVASPDAAYHRSYLMPDVALPFRPPIAP